MFFGIFALSLRIPLLSEMPRLISPVGISGEIGATMGNGGPEILAMADLVTDDVEADGFV